MIYHIFTAYTPKDPDTVRRNALAQTTWTRQPWKECPVRDEDLPRLWKEEDKALPYIRDVLDFACRDKQDSDIVVHTNADILVRGDASVEIVCRLQEMDACYCFRRDFGRLNSVPPDDKFVEGAAYAGHDMTAFRVGWWRQHRMTMPDMILGLEAWDPCIRLLIDMTNPNRQTTLHDLIAHERHGSFWEAPANRYRLNGQKYCLRLARAFLSSHGVDPRKHGIP